MSLFPTSWHNSNMGQFKHIRKDTLTDKIVKQSAERKQDGSSNALRHSGSTPLLQMMQLLAGTLQECHSATVPQCHSAHLCTPLQANA